MKRPAAGASRGGCAVDLWAYLAGDVPAATARRIATHLETCDECTRTTKSLAAVLAACRDAGGQELPRDVRARARRRVRALLAQSAATVPARDRRPPARRRRP